VVAGLGETSFVHPRVVLGLVVFSVLLFAVLRRREKRGLVFFALAWFLVALLPVSNLYPINAFMAEHWLYLPSIGFFLIIAGYFSTWLRRDRTRFSAWAGLILLAGFWGVLTVRQNVTWLEPIPFYQRLLPYAPFSSRLHNALGMAYNRKGEHEKGLPYIEKAAALSADASVRDGVQAYTNLAYVYDRLGRDREALWAAEQALALDPGHVKAYNNLAVSNIRLGRYEEALEACQRALAIDPRHADVLNTLGAVYMGLGRYEEALAAYRRVMQVDPDYATAYDNIELVLKRMGKGGSAE